ncbi:MAG: alpha/beta hydrolase [Pseudomonadales bacterium]
MDAFKLPASDGRPVHVYRWQTETSPRASVQIAHGMGEHAARYDHVARRLNDAGYVVYANDHRGHGETAESGAHGYMGEDGWNRTIDDAQALNAHIGEAHPGLPRVLLGHSMGSMLSQQFIYRHGEHIDALILSGSPGLGGAFSLWLSHTLARLERWRLGPDAESVLMQRLIFGDANKPFAAPEASGFEWLSRDSEQVQRYVDDPHCGFVLRAGSLSDLFAGAREARRREHITRAPRRLPVYVLSGSADPVHDGEKNLRRLLDRYQAHLENVEYRLYPEGRHEMFNETNRDEVLSDLIEWLERTLDA